MKNLRAILSEEGLIKTSADKDGTIYFLGDDHPQPYGEYVVKIPGGVVPLPQLRGWNEAQVPGSKVHEYIEERGWDWFWGRNPRTLKDHSYQTKYLVAPGRGEVPSHDAAHRKIRKWEMEEGPWPNRRRQAAAGSDFDKGKLSNKIRRMINGKLNRVGLDGNGRFRTPQKGYVRALDVLQGFGIELGEVVSSSHFREDANEFNVHLAFKNMDDPFSPSDIKNTMLHISYTKLEDDRYEVLAYMT